MLKLIGIAVVVYAAFYVGLAQAAARIAADLLQMVAGVRVV